jgi:hypothetical protein
MLSDCAARSGEVVGNHVSRGVGTSVTRAFWGVSLGGHLIVDKRNHSRRKSVSELFSLVNDLENGEHFRFSKTVFESVFLSGSQTFASKPLSYPPVNDSILRHESAELAQTRPCASTGCATPVVAHRSRSGLFDVALRVANWPGCRDFAAGLSLSQTHRPELVNGSVPTGVAV